MAVAGITDSIYLASEDFRPAAGVFLAVLAVFLVLGVLFSGKGLAAARLYGTAGAGRGGCICLNS